MILSELQPVISVLEQHANMHSKGPRTELFPNEVRHLLPGDPEKSGRACGTERRGVLSGETSAGAETMRLGSCWNRESHGGTENHAQIPLITIENHWKSLKYNFTTNRYQQDHRDHLIREACLGSPTQALEVWPEVSASLYWGTQQGEVTCTGTIWKTHENTRKIMEDYGKWWKIQGLLYVFFSGSQVT